MDSDKVLVMEFGTMVEFDHPHILLQNKEGYFYSMVQETGHVVAEQLSRIAEECYHTKNGT
jgi:ATP-binding cassette subfamily C (CFTR/MRP) protein 4